MSSDETTGDELENRRRALDGLGLSAMTDLMVDTEKLVGLMSLAEAQGADRSATMRNPSGDSEDSVEITSMQKIRSVQDRSGQFTPALEIEMCRAKRYARPLSVLVFGLAPHKDEKDDAAVYRYLFLEKGLRRSGPDLLRIPDFWGKYDRRTIVFVFPETDGVGADRAAQRVVKSPEFVKHFADEIQRLDIFVGAAQLGPSIVSVAGFVEAAKANVVWNSAGKRLTLS